jgi:hypothetical protein
MELLELALVVLDALLLVVGLAFLLLGVDPALWLSQCRKRKDQAPTNRSWSSKPVQKLDHLEIQVDSSA